MDFLMNAMQSLPASMQLSGPLAWTITALVAAGVTMGVVSLVALLAVYAERKVSADMQARVGPMHVGWHGILQTTADAIKLMLKEDLVPAMADKWLFITAPLLVFGGAFIGWAVLPLCKGWAPVDLNIGVVYLLATSSLVALGIIMAGWGSHNKWSLYGAMRTAAQFLSYEIPTALHLLPAILLAGSLNLTALANSQAGGMGNMANWAIWNPFCFLSFFCYFISGLAETNRVPFDLPESESELVAGFHVEYSGMRFAFFFLAEYAELFLVSAIASLVFLGGWNGPFGLESSFLYLAKVLVMMFVAIWLRWTLPRFRIDQLMGLCWKFLIPLGLINILGVGFWIYYFRT
ncbi:MAG: NADH-quinone oxidoreductase subunit NuoH [bacterium]|nr:NADH-quinone oxidoreductase subunit NuoH [bacterium]